MRPLEWVILVGVSLLLIWWAMGWRINRWGSIALGLVTLLHLVIERQRANMWPLYLIVAIAVAAAVLRPTAPKPAPGRWRLVGRWIVAGILLTMVVPLPWLLPVMRIPAPTGPLGVGMSWMVVTDSSRTERFGGGPRTFPVKIWYPVAAGSTGKTAPYSRPDEVTLGILPAILFDQLRLVKTHSLVDAPIAPGSERYPVLVFSHGYGGAMAQNTPQMEELASRGYVVFSIGHTGEASTTPFPDGRLVAFDSALGAMLRGMASSEGMAKAQAQIAALERATTAPERLTAFKEFLAANPEPLRSASVAEWAADTKALVDRLEQLDAGSPAGPFRGRLGLDKLGIFGMSYGGATAGEFCRLDRRCRAGFNIDGGQFGGLVDDSLTVPFFILASEQAYSAHTVVLDVSKGPSYLVRVPKTMHVGLTDMSLMAPVLFRWSGLTGKLDPDRRERIMNEYLVAFFDTYLKGQHSALLDGPSTADPDVSFISRNP